MPSPTTLLSRVPTILSAVAAIAILILATLGVKSWLAARDSTAQLSATIAAQKQLLSEAAAREAQRDAALATTLSAIARAKNNVQTPAQAAAQIPNILPSLPAPISLSIPAPTAGEPAPLAEASIPQADLKPIYDDLQDCRACQAQFAAAEADLSDERSKTTALTTERDAAVKAAQGGNFWSRLRRGTKWLIIGSALGAVAASSIHR